MQKLFTLFRQKWQCFWIPHVKILTSGVLIVLIVLNNWTLHYYYISVCCFRYHKLAELGNVQVEEDSCTLCFDNKANAILKPCNHQYV